MKYISGLLLLFLLLFITGCKGRGVDEDTYIDIAAHQQVYMQHYYKTYGDSPAGKEEYEKEMQRILDKHGVTMEAVEDYADRNPKVLRDRDVKRRIQKRMKQLRKEVE